MDAEILAIGSELLLGTTIDTNTAYLSSQLASIGVNVYRTGIVGDNTERIAACVRESLSRADLLICTGGMGPTVDDVTRDGVALAFGRPLEFHQELYDQVAARFASLRRPMSASNRRQAYIPQGARPIPNPVGTAPCFMIEDEHGTVIVLPGVPAEMRYLFEHVVQPYLRDERGVREVILVRVLHAVGLGESVIGERIADLMEQANPTVGISAKQARYELRIGAKADSPAAAQAMLDSVTTELEARLGTVLIGSETLDQQVVRLLIERDLTLALYEGHVAAPVYTALRQAILPTDRLRGVTIHPLDSPVPEGVTARAHTGAINARDHWRSTLGLGVELAATPDERGYHMVVVVLVTPEGTLTQEQYYDLRQREGLNFIGTLGLGMVRRYLLGETTT